MLHKNIMFLALAVLLILAGARLLSLVEKDETQVDCKPGDFVRGSILVVLKEDVEDLQAREIIKDLGGEIITHYSASGNIFSVKVPESKEKFYVKKFQDNSFVISAEVDQCVSIDI